MTTHDLYSVTAVAYALGLIIVQSKFVVPPPQVLLLKPSISHSNWQLQLSSEYKHDICSGISNHHPSLRPARLCPLPQPKIDCCLLLPFLDFCPCHFYPIVDRHQGGAYSQHKVLYRDQVHLILSDRSNHSCRAWYSRVRGDFLGIYEELVFGAKCTKRFCRYGVGQTFTCVFKVHFA